MIKGKLFSQLRALRNPWSPSAKDLIPLHPSQELLASALSFGLLDQASDGWLFGEILETAWQALPKKAHRGISLPQMTLLQRICQDLLEDPPAPTYVSVRTRPTGKGLQRRGLLTIRPGYHHETKERSWQFLPTEAGWLVADLLFLECPYCARRYDSDQDRASHWTDDCLYNKPARQLEAG